MECHAEERKCSGADREYRRSGGRAVHRKTGLHAWWAAPRYMHRISAREASPVKHQNSRRHRCHVASANTLATPTQTA
jgi:hypothetical protein